MADDADIIPLADEPPPARAEPAIGRRGGPGGSPGAGRPAAASGTSAKPVGRGAVGGPPVRSAGTCSGCGYVLTGLPLAATRCPECGAILPRLRADKRTAHAAEVARHAWREPIWYLAGALPAAAVLAVAAGGWELGVVHLIAYAVMLPVLLGTYMLCCWMWLGFDAPWPLVLLRLAAVQAVCDVAFFAGSLTGVQLIALIAGGVTYVGMMVKLMEIDFGDAVLVGLVGMLLKGAAAYALLSMLG